MPFATSSKRWANPRPSYGGSVSRGMSPLTYRGKLTLIPSDGEPGIQTSIPHSRYTGPQHQAVAPFVPGQPRSGS